MAITVIYYSVASGRSAHFYDLTGAVGMGSKVPNQLEDVLLAQTLMDIIFYIHPMAEYPGPSSIGKLNVDGKYTTNTHLHLAHFKQLMRKKGHQTPSDGKMDPIPGGPYKKTRRGYLPVLNAMNGTALVCCTHAQKPNDYMLHGPRDLDTFQVDPRLLEALQKNRRTDPDNWPPHPLPL